MTHSFRDSPLRLASEPQFRVWAREGRSGEGCGVLENHLYPLRDDKWILWLKSVLTLLADLRAGLPSCSSLQGREVMESDASSDQPEDREPLILLFVEGGMGFSRPS